MRELISSLAITVVESTLLLYTYWDIFILLKNYYVTVQVRAYINNSQCISPPDTSTFCIFLTQWLWTWSSDLLWTMWHHQTWPKQKLKMSFHIGDCPPITLLLPYSSFLKRKDHMKRKSKLTQPPQLSPAPRWAACYMQLQEWAQVRPVTELIKRTIPNTASIRQDEIK